MSSEPVHISLEFTPNPNTLKYSVNRLFLERGAANFVNLDSARDESPLAEKLFGIEGVCGVMIGKDFVTISKREEGDWAMIHDSASKCIETHLSEGGVVLSHPKHFEEGHGIVQTEVEQKIREILDREIRPAVAMDGGDITFEKFEAGIVFLQMQGSCAGCPSSTATLKEGIEKRLKEEIPEIVEVLSV